MMSNSYSSPCVRIGLCTDTHYWSDNIDNMLSVKDLQLPYHSEQLQTTLLAELESANVDMVIHLGDLTCGGGSFDMPRDKFLQALHETHAGFSSLMMPVHALPGNHDCLPGGSDWSLFENLWQLASGSGRTIDTPYARLILINAQGHSVDQINPVRPHDPVYGWVNDAEMARVEADLASANGRPVFVFLHQLLRPWSGSQPWQDFYGVRNADSVLALLRKYSTVQAVFQGHAHRLDVQTVWHDSTPCTYIVTPSIVEYPVGWLLLTLTATTLEIEMRVLPLPHLQKKSLYSRGGQEWRAGKPEWQNFTIPLAETDRVR